MLSDKKIRKYLEGLEGKLRKGRQPVRVSEDWHKKFPTEAGVYLAWEGKGDNPVYVGETGSIRGRMKDLRDSRNHNLRRNLGRRNFSGEKDYKDASAKAKFPPDIEKKVDDWLEKKIKISVLPVKLGRKELEEHIYRKYEPRYNKRGKRKGI